MENKWEKTTRYVNGEYEDGKEIRKKKGKVLEEGLEYEKKGYSQEKEESKETW